MKFVTEQLYRLLSRCGHLDFTPFQLIVIKLRLDEIIVWCHVCAMNVSILYCYGNMEHDQDRDRVIKVYSVEGKQELGNECESLHCIVDS